MKTMFPHVLGLAMLVLSFSCGSQVVHTERRQGSHQSSREQNVDYSNSSFVTQIQPSSLKQKIILPSKFQDIEIIVPGGLIKGPTDVYIDLMHNIVDGETSLALDQDLTAVGPSIRIKLSEEGSPLTVLSKPIEVRLPSYYNRSSSFLGRIGSNLWDDSNYVMVQKYPGNNSNECIVSTKKAELINSHNQISIFTERLGAFGVAVSKSGSTSSEAVVPECNLLSHVEIEEFMKLTDSTTPVLNSFSLTVIPRERILQATAIPNFKVKNCTLFITLSTSTKISVQTATPSFKYQFAGTDRIDGRTYMRCAVSGSTLRVSTTSLTFSLPATSEIPTVALSINPISDIISSSKFEYNPTVNGATSYLWSFVSGPGSLFIESPQARTTFVSASLDGTYVLRLRATNSIGESITQDFNFVWDTTPPVIDPLADLITNSPIDVTTKVLGAINYSWTKVSGPGSLLFSSPLGASTRVSSSLDGDYRVSFTATDEAGNRATREFNFVWDTTGPSIKPISDLIASKPIDVTAEIFDAQSVSWSKVSGPGDVVLSNNSSTLTTISAVVDGTYTLRLSAMDALGNPSSYDFQFQWDTTPPVVQNIEKVASSSQTLISPVVSGATRFTWSKLSGPGDVVFSSSTAPQTTVHAFIDGDYQIEFSASDEAGNVSAVQFTLSWDTVPPSVAQLSDIVTNKEALLLPEVNGAVRYQWAKISGPGSLQFGSPQSSGTTVSASLDGIYAIRFLASDAAGNTSHVDFNFIWDTTPPSIRALEAIYTNHPLEISPNVTGATSYSWSVITGLGTVLIDNQTSSTTQLSASSDGVYQVRFTAADALGQTSYIDIPFVWDTTPPDISVTAEIYTNVGYLISPQVSESGSFSWRQVSGNGNLTFGQPNGPETLVTASEDGTYEIDFTVKDLSGNESSRLIVFVWDTVAPSVDFPTNVKVGGLRVTLEPKVANYDHASWTFLEGPGVLGFSSSAAVWPTVTVDRDGVYKVRLSVTDLAGNLVQAESSLDFKSTLSAKSVSAGSLHTCALLDDNSVKCWGGGSHGQLGNGSNRKLEFPEALPVDLGQGRTAVQLVTGSLHTCALLDNDSVKCWGSNSFGQLGYGDNLPRLKPSDTTVDFGFGRIARQIAAGASHTCALLDDGSVKCWGYNINGQLGYGDNVNQLTPPDIAIDLGVERTARQIAAGGSHTCALLDNDTVKCWGAGHSGQLGYGNTSSLSAPSSSTIDFGAERTARQIVGGNTHTCAILDDTTARCWGTGSNGLLGYGNTTQLNAPISTPISLGPGRSPQKIVAGTAHTCALLDDNSVKCWGAGHSGQLGDGQLTVSLSSPLGAVAFPSGKYAVNIAAGARHTCAVLNDSSLHCWGDGQSGQVGHGNSNSLVIPPKGTVDVGPNMHFVSIAAGFRHTCARLNDGSVKCWGYGLDGQLGYGDLRSVPSPLGANIDLLGGTPSKIAAAQQHTCVLLSNGNIKCWGSGSSGQLGYGGSTNLLAPSVQNVPLGIAGATARDVAAGNMHTCAILNDSTVRCWGSGSDGQLGYGALQTRLNSAISTPVNLGTGRTARKIVAGSSHTCALLDNNGVKCWGNGGKGQLGYGNLSNQSSPPSTFVNLGLGRTAFDISAGLSHTCALLDDYSVKCWGDNTSGQAGVNSTTTYTVSAPPVSSINFGAGLVVKALASGSLHSCAILGDNSLRCWGDNMRGQIGSGSPEVTFRTPALVNNLGGTPLQIALGGQHTCILFDNGSLKCWGAGESGQLGVKNFVNWAPLAQSISYEAIIY